VCESKNADEPERGTTLFDGLHEGTENPRTAKKDQSLGGEGERIESTIKRKSRGVQMVETIGGANFLTPREGVEKET